MKRLFIFLLCILLCLSFASALEVQDTNFLEGESIIIIFNESGVELSDFGLYDNDTKVSISYFVRDIDNFSIAAFNAPSRGEYLFKHGEENLTFTVDEGEGLGCNPRYAYLTEDEDEFTVQLLYSDATVYVGADSVSPIRDSIEVTGSANLKVEYDYEGLEDNIIELTYGDRTYNYMVFVERQEVVEDVFEDNETEVVEEGEVYLVINGTYIEEIDKSVGSSVRLRSYVSVENNLNEDLTDVDVEMTGYLLDISQVGSIEDIISAGKSESFLLTINEDRDAVGVYSGELVVTSNEYELVVPITYEFIEEEEDETANETLDVDLPEVNLSGPSLEGPRDDGGEEDNRAFYIGLVVLFVVILIFVYILLKLRRKPQKKFGEVVEERQEPKQ